MNIDKALDIVGKHEYGTFKISDATERCAFLKIYSYAVDAQDKIHRRNMQIKELKEKVAELTSQLYETNETLSKRIHKF